MIITTRLIFAISKNKSQTYPTLLKMDQIMRLPEIVTVSMKKRLVPLEVTLSSSFFDSDS